MEQLNPEEKKLYPQENPASSLGKAQTFLEIYRITTDLIAKLVLPAVLFFAILTFRPTIDSLFTRTTEAEVVGARFKFAQRASERIDKAVKTGEPEEVNEVMREVRAEALLRSFLTPDDKGTSNRENVEKLRLWMSAYGIERVPIVKFLDHPQYAEARERAVRDLGLVKH
jgi:hypothetical protein